MEILIIVAILALCAGGVALNHHNRRTAFAGVEFALHAHPAEVVSALEAVYCQGAKAALRRGVTGVRVRRSGDGFAFTTKFGDTGEIDVVPTTTGSAVRVVTTSVYVGSTLTSSNGQPLWQVSKALSNLLLRALGFAPNAAKLKRFQRRVEPKVSRHLSRAATRERG